MKNDKPKIRISYSDEGYPPEVERKMVVKALSLLFSVPPTEDEIKLLKEKRLGKTGMNI